MSNDIALRDVANPKINLADRNVAGSMGEHLSELVSLLNRAVAEKRLGAEEARTVATTAKTQENALGVYRLVQAVEGKTKIFVQRRESMMGYSGSFALEVHPFPLGDMAVLSSIYSPEDKATLASILVGLTTRQFPLTYRNHV